MMQDATFHERVLDLANLVLASIAGPEAQHSMAAAVDPARDQVPLLQCTHAMPLLVCCTHLVCTLYVHSEL